MTAKSAANVPRGPWFCDHSQSIAVHCFQSSTARDDNCGQVSLMIVDFATTPATIVRVGSYTDALVLTSQGWRFSKRVTSYPVAPPKPQ